MEERGVTVLEAVADADAGDIWETSKFKMRPVGKSSIYRHEVRHAAVEMLVMAVHSFARGDFEPLPLQAEESWYNLHTIDDIVREILETDSHITISALSGDAAAGGVPFAASADHVVAREDVVLNPYHQHMGGLYGSEYWTYVLPRRIGDEPTAELTSAPFTPIGTRVWPASNPRSLASASTRWSRSRLPCCPFRSSSRVWRSRLTEHRIRDGLPAPDLERMVDGADGLAPAPVPERLAARRVQVTGAGSWR
jgi:hypothetical protein